MDYSYFPTLSSSFNYAPTGPSPRPAHAQSVMPEEQYGSASPQRAEPLHYQGYETFVPQYDPSTLTPDMSLPGPEHRPSIGGGSVIFEGENERPGRSSSEEKETLTPAQSRRKAQNRAAQRAFRERKERHVKDLEQKLTSLEQTSNALLADNQRLKRELHRVSTENEMLRNAAASSALGSNLPRETVSAASPSSSSTTAPAGGPTRYTPMDFYNTMLHIRNNNNALNANIPSHLIAMSERTGERLVGAGPTWDLIQNHPLIRTGFVDIVDVSERLKEVVQCDGQGPAFYERSIFQAIEASAAASRTARTSQLM